jgi:hypothetical protein
MAARARDPAHWSNIGPLVFVSSSNRHMSGLHSLGRRLTDPAIRLVLSRGLGLAYRVDDEHNENDL